MKTIANELFKPVKVIAAVVALFTRKDNFEAVYEEGPEIKF